ncbi:DUF928 domain-containing protein [Sphaerospermopsis aphanizomenoides BCCUSP55]|uniref:DUF928 domain-containing protein n=1 Tax=Sphaerospermopsis aphanizomenoides TaxID=459663 RepID=UPI0019039C42|nr:DUF928 domain-containing protein [Sphaerospermopsis aphanizomenoides]MBK1987771.1 DUF928 domain-containing protein [Sphaerospermopsis aphanizomenoides BCCUSP55]
MVTKNTGFFLKTLTVRLLTAIFIISSLPTQGKAQLTPGYLVSVKFPLATNRGAPERTAPGGRRGGCDLDNLIEEATPSDSNSSKIKLTAVVPINNMITTVVPNPSVYVHIPVIIDTEVKFHVVEKDTKKEVYTTDFSLPHIQGIVKVQLPKTVKLQPNKIYTWEFKVICDPDDSSDDKLLKGWIERTSLTSEKMDKIEQLKQKPLEQAKLYAEFGVWNETVEILESLRENPQAEIEWDELLESVELQQLANAPVNNCCQVANSPTTPTNTNNTEKTKPTSSLKNDLEGSL